MDLNDLFVSYKQVEPVSFTPSKPNLPNPIYVNLNRAKQTVATHNNSNDHEILDDDMSTWRVDPVNKKKTTEKSENKTKNGTKLKSKTESKTESKTLQEYRTNPGYKEFKTELDKFITNNPKYSDIKDDLDYLAALESRYIKGVENYQGSKALGWFQFMDNTRAPYNKQSRQEFANDAQSQLLTAAKYYRHLQNQIKNRGGDPTDFVTMYGAWWRPSSAYKYITNPNYNYTSDYNEYFLTIRNRAAKLFE